MSKLRVRGYTHKNKAGKVIFWEYLATGDADFGGGFGSIAYNNVEWSYTDWGGWFYSCSACGPVSVSEDFCAAVADAYRCMRRGCFD